MMLAAAAFPVPMLPMSLAMALAALVAVATPMSAMLLAVLVRPPAARGRRGVAAVLGAAMAAAAMGLLVHRW